MAVPSHGMSDECPISDHLEPCRPKLHHLMLSARGPNGAHLRHRKGQVVVEHHWRGSLFEATPQSAPIAAGPCLLSSLDPYITPLQLWLQYNQALTPAPIAMHCQSSKG